MNFKRCLLFVLPMISFSLPVYAVPSIDGRPGPKEYVRPQNRNLSRRSPGINDVINPATGKRKIAVILVEFSGAGEATNTNFAATLSTTDIKNFNYTFNYLKKFYNEASYGSLNLEITFITQSSSLTLTDTTGLSGNETPYLSQNTIAYYGSDNNNGQAKLIMDSLALVGSSVTAADFDALLIAHAGYGEESNTGNKADIWSAMTDFGTDTFGNPILVNGFGDGAVFPAREVNGASPIGVTCHEFGHLLGLPDLYNTITGKLSAGFWCLMDEGAWSGDGATPAPPSLWCRALEGWAHPVVMVSQQELTGIKQFETSSNTVYNIPVLNSSSEYFLVCYSSLSVYNVVPPGQGFLIWHVDEGIIDNTTFAQRMLANEINSLSHNTVQMDTASGIPTNVSPYGTSQDPWPGKKITFAPPDSNSYSGRQSGIVLSNFSLPGQPTSVNLSANKLSDAVSIIGMYNYPNPAGAGNTHPRQSQGIITTFVIQCSAPPKNLSLDIYTVAGEHVKSAGNSSFNYYGRAGADYKWVYQFDWDGRNEAGDTVAPGIYLYKVKADGVIKMAKMAIVR